MSWKKSPSIPKYFIYTKRIVLIIGWILGFLSFKILGSLIHPFPIWALILESRNRSIE
ncbi:DUF5670 family protein [Zobellia uliginosa]|uniref:DUF5670 family protein n=1 Tax=Zobellia uliginosa TaxID=143224 RepID=UPI00349F2102